MVSRAIMIFLGVLAVLMLGCQDTRSPEVCIYFDSSEDQAGLIRSAAAKIAAQRGLKFTDESGQQPWPYLTIYIGLEGNGFHVVGRHQKGFVGTMCFYKEKSFFSGESEKDEGINNVLRDFTEMFGRQQIPFEIGKARPAAVESSRWGGKKGPLAAPAPDVSPPPALPRPNVR
jgi:hypothetical protein